MAYLGSESNFLFTQAGSRLELISHAEYVEDQTMAIRPPLETNGFYTARATSHNLSHMDYALEFIVRAAHPYRIEGYMARTGFTLLLLDDNLQKRSTHFAEIDANGGWTVRNGDTPISIVDPDRNQRIIDKLRTGYLMPYTDDPYVDEFYSTQKKPQLNPQHAFPPLYKRPHPLYPISEE